MKRVYIAGPYTLGDVNLNVRTAIDAANELANHGLVPYVPHLTHYWHLVHPRPYAEWLRLDLEWLKFCDVVLRLLGNSTGADNEMRHAIDVLDIPVYYSMNRLLEDYYRS